MVNIAVITYLTGYPFPVFERFAGSLYDTGFKGNLFLIHKPQDIPHIEKLQEMYPLVIPVIDRNLSSNHLNCHRFILMKELKPYIPQSTEYILFCDGRDVLFQRNIEDLPFNPEDELFVFQEELSIQEEKRYNALWVLYLERSLKEPIYHYIKKNKILCAGTILGKRECIFNLFQHIADVVETNKIRANLDQAILNYLLYKNLFKANVRYLANKDNWILTMGLCKNKTTVKEDGMIYFEGDLPFVVHQYDRLSEEQRRLIQPKYDCVI